MEPRSKQWRRDVALILVGAVIAAFFITPAGAHVGTTVDHLWKKHIKPLAAKAFYTKKKANDRFLKKTAKAADSDKVDGVDGARLQQNCQDGALLASGYVNGDVVEGAFATTGLDNVYSCLGEVQIREDIAGIYSLKFAEATTGGIVPITWTPRMLVTANNNDDQVANYETYTEAGFVLVRVRLRDVSSGGAATGDFTFAATALDCGGVSCSLTL